MSSPRAKCLQLMNAPMRTPLNKLSSSGHYRKTAKLSRRWRGSRRGVVRKPLAIRQGASGLRQTFLHGVTTRGRRARIRSNTKRARQESRRRPRGASPTLPMINARRMAMSAAGRHPAGESRKADWPSSSHRGGHRGHGGTEYTAQNGSSEPERALTARIRCRDLPTRMGLWRGAVIGGAHP